MIVSMLLLGGPHNGDRLAMQTRNPEPFIMTRDQVYEYEPRFNRFFPSRKGVVLVYTADRSVQIRGVQYEVDRAIIDTRGEAGAGALLEARRHLDRLVAVDQVDGGYRTLSPTQWSQIDDKERDVIALRAEWLGEEIGV